MSPTPKSPKPPKPRTKEILPTEQVLEQLAAVRRTFREVMRHYGDGVEAEITGLIHSVSEEGETKRAIVTKTKDFRDMLMLLHSLDVKPVKGRRRDLKRVETLVTELRLITDRW